MVSLSSLSLPSIASQIEVPHYDRQIVTEGIVHIGVGGFHRAHEAVYMDDLLNIGYGAEWGICGVGIRQADKAMRDALVPQDCLYTVATRDADGDKARVIGAMTNYLFGPDDPAAVREKLAAPETRIVSLTITEGGYGETQGPQSAFAYLAEALDLRRQRNLTPFTVLSCDNLQSNGIAARNALLTYAEKGDAGLLSWIETNVSFPNCMVDRITPQTTDADRELVRKEFGIDDAWPVVCEPFRQWIIEDNFVNGRPKWERVGVQFTTDVHPYETMKLRLLNASHSAMGYLGFLAGFTYIHEVIANPLFREFIARLLDDEITPLLPPVAGIDLTDYKQTLLVRFANPAIKDQVTRICLDGSSKVPKFLLPSVQEALATGRPTHLLSLAVAGWLRYLTGVDEQENIFAIDDPRAETLQRLARQGKNDPRPLLSQTEIFGDLRQSAVFVRQLQENLLLLSTVGALETVRRAISLAGNSPLLHE